MLINKWEVKDNYLQYISHVVNKKSQRYASHLIYILSPSDL